MWKKKKFIKSPKFCNKYSEMCHLKSTIFFLFIIVSIKLMNERHWTWKCLCGHFILLSVLFHWPILARVPVNLILKTACRSCVRIRLCNYCIKSYEHRNPRYAFIKKEIKEESLRSRFPTTPILFNNTPTCFSIIKDKVRSFIYLFYLL